jgi:tetratricopeptide (TPR) repeat protein
MQSRLIQLQNFLESSPNDAFLLFAIAKEYEGAGALEEALTHYIQLRETTPQYVGLYYHLGKLYEKMSQLDNALEAYKTGMAVAKSEKDMHAYNELVGARMNIDDFDEDEE